MNYSQMFNPQKKSIFRLFSTLILLFCFFTIEAQNFYQQAWEKLSNREVEEAERLFKKSISQKKNIDESRLSLTLLHIAELYPDQANQIYLKYIAEAENPAPATAALWSTMAVANSFNEQTADNRKTVETIMKHPKMGQIKEQASYWSAYAELVSYNTQKGSEMLRELNAIRDWKTIGPFSNLMNGGFDLDYGVVNNPQDDVKLINSNGTELTWIVPKRELDEPFFETIPFKSDNSIFYVQSFVEAEDEETVYLKFGYYGTLKLWLNDSLVFQESQPRSTGIAYTIIETTLNKGFNRVLAQLADNGNAYSQIAVGFYDKAGNTLKLPAASAYRPYKKGVKSYQLHSNFAQDYYENNLRKNPDDVLSGILLSKIYLEIMNYDESEAILLDLLAKHPDNFLIIHELLVHYIKSQNETEKSKTLELLKAKYPESAEALTLDVLLALQSGNKTEVRRIVEVAKKKYEGFANEQLNEFFLLAADEDMPGITKMLEKLPENNDFDPKWILAKSRFEQNMGIKSKSTKALLETTINRIYNDGIANIVIGTMVDEGRIDDAIALLDKVSMTKVDLIPKLTRKLQIVFEAQRYSEALSIGKELEQRGSSNQSNLRDIAQIYKVIGNKDSALVYFQKLLKYYPYSFNTYEEIRSLRGEKSTIDLVEKISVDELIKESEANFQPKVKKSYDYIFDERSVFISPTKAAAVYTQALYRINDENGLESFQTYSYGSGAGYQSKLIEAMIIKPDGSKSKPEENGSDLVFTNLQIGDYVYLFYHMDQYSGSELTQYFSDEFSFSSYNPSYINRYNVYANKDVTIKYTSVNGEVPLIKTETDGFTKYTWEKSPGQLLKDETNVLPFKDIATRVTIGLDYSWNDVATWYANLTKTQVQPEFAIKELVKELGINQLKNDKEKAQKIYEFILKNIKYSSIDFRQSGVIPQKASTVYQSRLGDCKDVSSLFVSMANEVGLDAQLVLINTSDNGIRETVHPSIGFNHCIVKLKTKVGEPLYLELTDEYLPFGYLYSYHDKSSILEIPKNTSESVSLMHLVPNKNYKSKIYYKSKMTLDEQQVINIKSVKSCVGTRAATEAATYLLTDESERNTTLKEQLASVFKSEVNIINSDFSGIKKLADSTITSYSFQVGKDVSIIGSMKIFEIPLFALLASSNVFGDGDRVNDFDFSNYEDTDFYEEELEIELPSKNNWIELPENVTLQNDQFGDYQLTFKQLDNNKLLIHRTYKPIRKIVSVQDFPAFKAFMSEVIEKESSQLVYK